MSKWVHPNTHEISKLMPNSPPVRGDIVLVDGVRCRVLRCPVKWEGRRWQMKRGVKVKPARAESVRPVRNHA